MGTGFSISINIPVFMSIRPMNTATDALSQKVPRIRRRFIPSGRPFPENRTDSPQR